MKKTVLILVVVVVLVLTIPVAAKYPQPVGEQKSVWSFGPGCLTMPEGPPDPIPTFKWTAETPFYFSHGFVPYMVPSAPDLPPEMWAKLFALSRHAYFELAVDGEVQKPTIVYRYAMPDIGQQMWVNVYEFEDGMTGTHVFQGTYYYPVCGWNYIPVNECDDVTEIMIAWQCTGEVNFVGE